MILIPRNLLTTEAIDQMAAAMGVHLDGHPDEPPKTDPVDLMGDAAVLWDMHMDVSVEKGYLPEYGPLRHTRAYAGSASDAHRVGWLQWACLGVHMVSQTVSHRDIRIRRANTQKWDPPYREWPVYTQVLDKDWSLDWQATYPTSTDWNQVVTVDTLRRRCMLLNRFFCVGMLPEL